MLTSFLLSLLAAMPQGGSEPTSLVVSSPDSTWTRTTFNHPSPIDQNIQSGPSVYCRVYSAGEFVWTYGKAYDSSNGSDVAVGASAANSAGELWAYQGAPGTKGTVTETINLTLYGSVKLSKSGNSAGIRAAASVYIFAEYDSSELLGGVDVESNASAETSADSNWESYWEALWTAAGVTIPNPYTVGWGTHALPADTGQHLSSEDAESFTWETETKGVSAVGANGYSTAGAQGEIKSVTTAKVSGTITLTGP